MSSTIGGGVKPPVTNLPTETDGVSEAKTNETAAPAKTEAKAPVDAMEHTPSTTKTDTPESPKLETPTAKTATTETSKPVTTPPPIGDVGALSGLHAAIEITEVRPETFGDAFDQKWEIVHPGSLAGLSPRSPDADFDKPDLEGNPITVRIKLKEPAPGRLFNVKVEGPKINVKDAVCVHTKNSAKVIDRMLNAGMENFKKVDLEPTGHVNVHAPRFSEGGDLAKAFGTDGGARLELTAEHDTLLHRHDGTVDTSQLDFFRNRPFEPKHRDTPSTGTPSGNEAEAIVKYARKACANEGRTSVPGNTTDAGTSTRDATTTTGGPTTSSVSTGTDAPTTTDASTGTGTDTNTVDADELAKLQEALALATERANQAESAAKDARVKGFLHKWQAVAQKLGVSEPSRSLQRSVIKPPKSPVMPRPRPPSLRPPLQP